MHNYTLWGSILLEIIQARVTHPNLSREERLEFALAVFIRRGETDKNWPTFYEYAKKKSAKQPAKTPQIIQDELFQIPGTRHYPEVSHMILQKKYGEEHMGQSPAVALDHLLQAHRLVGEMKNRHVGNIVSKINKDERGKKKKAADKAKRFPHTKLGKTQSAGQYYAEEVRKGRENKEEDQKKKGF